MAGPEKAEVSKGPGTPSQVHTRFAALTSVPDLEQLLERSEEGPVWIFQHDPFCPISRAARKEVAQFDGEVGLVDVTNRHELARAIAARTGVRHESPQVLFIAHRQAAWTASHFAITAAAMAKAASHISTADCASLHSLLSDAANQPDDGTGRISMCAGLQTSSFPVRTVIQV